MYLIWATSSLSAASGFVKIVDATVVDATIPAVPVSTLSRLGLPLVMHQVVVYYSGAH